MARLSQPLIVLALAALTAAALSACGENDAQLLPGETAREITANLDTVKQLADEGDCVGAENAAQQVSEQIGALGGVDESLKETLRDGATRLNEVVTECEETTEAIEPAIVPTEAEPAEEDEEPEEKKPKDKEEEGDDDGNDERVEEPEGPSPETPESIPPPHAEGEGKGPEGEGSPSGGVSPGSAVGEGE